MWHKRIEQLPEVGSDVLFTIPSQNDNSIDVGWLDNGKDNGSHCFVGRAFSYDLNDVEKWRYTPSLDQFNKVSNDVILGKPLLVYIPKLNKSDCAYRIGRFEQDPDTQEIFFESDNDDTTCCIEDVEKWISLSSLI